MQAQKQADDDSDVEIIPRHMVEVMDIKSEDSRDSFDLFLPEDLPTTNIDDDVDQLVQTASLVEPIDPRTGDKNFGWRSPEPPRIRLRKKKNMCTPSSAAASKIASASTPKEEKNRKRRKGDTQTPALPPKPKTSSKNKLLYSLFYHQTLKLQRDKGVSELLCKQAARQAARRAVASGT